MNFKLVKCALGKHEYDNPIKNETLRNIEKYCIHCNKKLSIIKHDGLKDYETDKREIIDDIETDKLSHAKQKLNILLRKLGY